MGWFSAVASRVTQAFVVNQLGAELDRASEALRSPEVAARLDAVRLLATRPRGDADELLLSALRDADASVRAAAAAACGAREWREFVPGLGALLTDADAAVRMATLRALDELGTPGTALDGEPTIASSSLIIPADGRVPTMLATLTKDPDAAIRAEALAALPRHGVQGVQLAIAHVAAAAEADRSALVPLLERGVLLALGSHEPAHRKAAIEALHQHGCSGAARAIIECLKDAEPRVREAAMLAVAALAPAEGLPLLLARLDDPDRSAAGRAIESLMGLRAGGTLSPADLDALHERLLVLAAHGEGRAQVAATWALGEMGRVSAVRPLTGLLDSKSDDVVVEACGALERLRDPRAVDELCAIALGSTSKRARVAAAKALGGIGDVRAVAPLIDRLMRDPLPACVDAAEKALGAICAPLEQREREAMASTDPAARLAAIARIRGDVRGTQLLLASILDAPDQPCRDAAIAALSDLGQSAQALAEGGLRLPDQPEGRRLFALSLFAVLKPPTLVPLVGNLLRDPSEPVDVYLRAVTILAADAGPEARKQLENSKEHPNPTIRDAISAALGK